MRGSGDDGRFVAESRVIRGMKSLPIGQTVLWQMRRTLSNTDGWPNELAQSDQNWQCLSANWNYGRS